MNKNLAKLLVIGPFLALSFWWAWANITSNVSQQELFSDSYWVLPLLCSFIGFTAAQKWGGLRSIFGKAVTFLSLGLFLQAFGQIVSTYYARVQHIEAPYPSLGDVGFFGAVIAYILGAVFLIKTVSTRSSRSTSLSRILAIGVPAVLLGSSYFIFLKGHSYDFSETLVSFLDFGYPLGDAIYIASAILAYFFSKSLLGGIMKKRILFILAALIVQYAADFTFLYRFSREQYSPGGISDFVFLLAYLLMGLALISLVSAYNGISRGTTKEEITSDGQ